MVQQALIFDIKRGSSEDGPGIRSTVFFKGCPLSCVWCQNPEGMSCQPEIDTNGNSVGFYITLEELLYRVQQDIPIFTSSGGGVTLSGGEPSRQMDFAHHFLVALKKQHIHTAIETCGLFKYQSFAKKLLPWLDLIYFDLKLFDDFQSRRYTGRSNQPILDNFTRLINEAEIPIIPRIPLIPGITDSQENLSSWAEFLYKLGVSDCTLMPYNPLWQDKLQRLGLCSRYQRDTFMTADEQQTCINTFIASSKGAGEHAN